MQIRLCLKRGFQRLRGDMSLFLSNVIGNFIMGLIVSSIFYDLPKDTSSFYNRSALIFFAILMNAFSSILEVGFYPFCMQHAFTYGLQILTLYEQRPITEKHARMAFYHPASEAAAAMI